MPHRFLGLCVALCLACAGGDSSDSLSGQPYVPGGESTAAAGESESTSQPDSATSVAESTAASESTAALEPTSDCCTPAVAPGCTDPATQMCVCEVRADCCVDAWTVECAGIAVDGCGSECAAATTMDPSATTGEEPMQSCGELARTEDYVVAACEVNGNGACGGQGTPTDDCDFCCDLCETGNGPTCGQLAGQQGWEFANCESNGNNACNGMGTVTCDCDFCCEVML